MSPRIPAEERRNQILEAALTCFARNGYNGTSMDDIVAESGLSKGTLYWHFKSKRDLFMVLFDRIINQMVVPMQDLLETEGSAAERLRAMANAVGDFSNFVPDFATLPVNFLIEAWQDEGFTNHYKELIEAFGSKMEALIREGIASGEFQPIDAAEATWGIMAMLDGIILYAMVGMPGDPAKQLQIVTDLIIKGLQAR